MLNKSFVSEVDLSSPRHTYNARMIPLFLGLTIGNLAMLATVFTLGYATTRQAGSVHDYHLLLGLGAGLMTTLTHLTVYTYHMATSRWLEAATDKAGLALERFVEPALRRKRKAFFAAMAAVGVTMLAMFAGAAADPTARPLISGAAHRWLALIAIAVNLAAAVVEFRLIRGQGALIDEALAAMNRQIDANERANARKEAATASV